MLKAYYIDDCKFLDPTFLVTIFLVPRSMSIHLVVPTSPQPTAARACILSNNISAASALPCSAALCRGVWPPSQGPVPATWTGDLQVFQAHVKMDQEEKSRIDTTAMQKNLCLSVLVSFLQRPGSELRKRHIGHPGHQNVHMSKEIIALSCLICGDALVGPFRCDCVRIVLHAKNRTV